MMVSAIPLRVLQYFSVLSKISIFGAYCCIGIHNNISVLKIMRMSIGLFLACVQWIPYNFQSFAIWKTVLENSLSPVMQCEAGTCCHGN